MKTGAWRELAKILGADGDRLTETTENQTNTSTTDTANRVGPGRRRTTIYTDAQAIEDFFGAVEDITHAEAKAFRAQRGRKLATADVTSAALQVACQHPEEITERVRSRD